MAAEINLLFLEKKVEAARLCASLTEPYATGGDTCPPAQLAARYGLVLDQLEHALTDLKALNAGLDKAGLEPGDVRHFRQRVEVAVTEIARVAQDFAAQVRFFEAMNPGEPAAIVKPMLERFDAMDRATRDIVVKDAPDEGAELAPEESERAEDADPMLM